LGDPAFVIDARTNRMEQQAKKAIDWLNMTCTLPVDFAFLGESGRQFIVVDELNIAEAATIAGIGIL